MYEKHHENVSRKKDHGTANCGERNGRRKLTKDQAVELKRRFLAGERSADLATEFNVHRSHVSRIARGANWGDALTLD
jgi:DNA invertase Pin-like site-specific DNA recombinase